MASLTISLLGLHPKLTENECYMGGDASSLVFTVAAASQPFSLSSLFSSYLTQRSVTLVHGLLQSRYPRYMLLVPLIENIAAVSMFNAAIMGLALLQGSRQPVESLSSGVVYPLLGMVLGAGIWGLKKLIDK